ncbi:hypothetical protein NT6N_22950 [Oceaniferula spumae]|uniref:Ice-binding protein C-terminal domain-containing protein n=1 Tax=Oceaniferula spumae TaxID=2979115 RepID=A0AAT9FMK5_9BACT
MKSTYKLIGSALLASSLVHSAHAVLLYSHDFSIDEADAVANGTPGSSGTSAGDMVFDRNGSSPLSASISGGSLLINSDASGGANNVTGYTPSFVSGDYGGINVMAEISSITGIIGGNGQFVGLSNNMTDNYNNSGSSYAGFFLRNAGGMASFRNTGGGRPAGTEFTADYASFQDGYTIDFTMLADDSFSYTISGLTNIVGDLGFTGTVSGDGTSVSGTGSFAGGTYTSLDAVTPGTFGALTAQADVDNAGTVTVGYDSFAINSVPEPSSTALLGLGAALLIGRRRRV